MPQFQKGLEIVQVRASWATSTRCTSPGTATARAGCATKYDIDPATVDWKRFLGAAREQPFDEYRFRNWRWFWDFGGGILTDLMVHQVDIAHWFLGLDHPQTAATIGDAFKAPGLWETPDTVQTLLHYPKQKAQVYFEGTFVNARNAAMLEFMGSEATLVPRPRPL